jgi:hypothetical protein
MEEEAVGLILVLQSSLRQPQAAALMKTLEIKSATQF